MEYREKIDSYFENQIKNIFSNDNIFGNRFEEIIFCLIQNILEHQSNESFHIEIPMRELGSEDYSKNYASFCGSIAFSSAKHVYTLNKENNILCDIGNSEYFFDNNRIYIRRGDYKIPFDDFGTRNENNTRILIGNGRYSKLLRPTLFKYNSQNGINKIKEYIEWVKLFDHNPVIINKSNKKVLIISHSEIEKSIWFSKIPNCKISNEDNEVYSSPIDPLIYIAREECPKVTELVKNRNFETIIFIGDSKFYEGGTWSERNDYFKKRIYVGFRKPESSKTFYSFSPTEIQSYYNSAISNENYKFVKAENNDFTTELSNFIEVLKTIKEKGGSFKFSILPLLNRTAPISQEIKEQLVEWFDNRILNSMTLLQDEELIENLTIAYEAVLDKLIDGNSVKIKICDEILNNLGNKESKKSVVIFVNDRDEVDFFSKKYNINKNKIIKTNSCSRKLKNLANSNKNRKQNLFIYLSYDATFNESLKILESFSLLGKRIFIGQAESLFSNMINERNKLEQYYLSKECRKSCTDIEYNFKAELSKTDILNEQLSINDFTFDDNNDFNIQKNNKLETFTITLEDESIINLSGSVELENTIVDIEDLNEGDIFSYYSPNTNIFNKIFSKLYPNLNEEIEYCSSLWTKALHEIKDLKFNNKIKGMYTDLQTNGWKTHENTLKSYLSSENKVQFPQSSSLKALKKYCDKIGSHEYHCCKIFSDKYIYVRKAQAAQASKTKLGRLLCRHLFDYKIGIDVSDFINKLGDELWDELYRECLKSGTVKYINKSKD